jgi:two-component system, sensor histidine kinase and response regulator
MESDSESQKVTEIQRQFLQTSPVGVIVADCDDAAIVRYVNPAAAAIFGMLPEALISQRIVVLAAGGNLEELLVEALVSERQTNGEIVLGDAGMPQRHIRASIMPGQYEGRQALYWWIDDVTDIRRTEAEWRRRERQLHAVIDAAQDAVFEFALNTGGASVSPRFWQMLGFDPTEADNRQNTSAETIYHHIREDNQLDFAASMRLPSQDEPYEWTGPFRSVSGEDVWLYLRGRFTDVLTEPRIIGVVTDITAQKAVEENLRRAKESAEEANRAKSAFLATMSHEIRTPMTAILGSLEYLLETPLVKDQHRMVSIARDSGESLLAILNDILDLSKIEAGKLSLELLPTSPRTLVQGACDAATIVARQKNLYLRCKFTAPPPPLIVLDPVRVRQLLMNLVNNAVKFTEQGGVSVTAEIAMAEPGEAILRVTVQDSGIGLTDLQKAKLFKPFSQADDSTTRKFGGTGLGLSICQRLVERMGGEIGVYSKQGQGATFWFWVKVQTTDQLPGATEVVDLKGMPILLVDPDPETQSKTAENLAEVGGKVEAVGDGREAMLHLARQQYGLVLLEQNLPEAKGLDLVPAMRALHPELNILLYTATEQDTIAWAAQEASVFYLPRSTPYEQFLETVESFASGAPLIDTKKAGALTGRVLIAEDTASVRQILEVQVRGLGVEVDFVENGKQALERLAKGRYALVVTDLHMPEVDGYGLVHEWRAREAKRGKSEHLPIVALTADVLIGDASKFIAEGFDDYMAKPVSRDALRNLIAKWLNRAAGQTVVADEPAATDAPSPATVAKSDSQAPVDHARLIEILGMDDADILAEAMDMFVMTANETLAVLEKAYQAGDSKAAKGPAHSLKGSARMAGAIKLGDIAAELDAAAKADSLLPDRLEACKVELKLVIDHIKKTYLKP